MLEWPVVLQDYRSDGDAHVPDATVTRWMP